MSVEVSGEDDIIEALEEIETDLLDGVGETWTIGSNVEYARYVEFGTTHMSAQPHLRPAFDVVMNMKFEQFARQAETSSELLKRAAFEIESEVKRRSPVRTGRLRSSYEANRD